jgi:hypothetical protein
LWTERKKSIPQLSKRGGRKKEVGLGCFYSLGSFSGLKYNGIGSSGYISTK